MIIFHYKAEYLKQFDGLPTADQKLVIFADEQIRHFHEKGEASYGLRIKKLYAGKRGEIFEARVSRSLRTLWAKQKKEITFVLVGNHDDVQRYLKNL